VSAWDLREAKHMQILLTCLYAVNVTPSASCKVTVDSVTPFASCKVTVDWTLLTYRQLISGLSLTVTLDTLGRLS